MKKKGGMVRILYTYHDKIIMIKVSIIMSVYNAELYLKESIESILNQTYKNIEFIIINDGSSDKSLEIIKSYKDNRIILLDNIQNRGLIYSLNIGIDKATGEYIARMDADDISLFNRIEEQVKFMQNNPKIDISGSNAICFGDKIKPYKRIMPKKSQDIKSSLLTLTPFIHPSIIVKSKIMKENKYDLKYNGLEDFELWVRILKKYKGWNLQKVLLKYRILDTSITRVEEKKYKERFTLLNKVYGGVLDEIGNFSKKEKKVLTLINNRAFIEKDYLISGQTNTKDIIKLINKIKKEDKNKNFKKNILTYRYVIYLILKNKIEINYYSFIGLLRIFNKKANKVFLNISKN